MKGFGEREGRWFWSVCEGGVFGAIREEKDFVWFEELLGF